MAALGSKVIVADIDFEAALQVAQEISSKKQASIAVQCDVTSVESIRKARDATRNHFGSPTILVNNAGIYNAKLFTDLSYKEIENTMMVNSISHFYAIKEMLPDMIKANKGHIVSIASVAGLIGGVYLSDYCPSKFAVIGLNEALRHEFRFIGANIQTTLVCPALVDTNMAKKVPSWLPRFKVEWVGEKIVEAIRYNETFLVMPNTYWKIKLVLKSMLPDHWMEMYCDFEGILRRYWNV